VDKRIRRLHRVTVSGENVGIEKEWLVAKMDIEIEPWYSWLSEQ
jgi:hypothetical protein